MRLEGAAVWGRVVPSAPGGGGKSVDSRLGMYSMAAQAACNCHAFTELPKARDRALYGGSTLPAHAVRCLAKCQGK